MAPQLEKSSGIHISKGMTNLTIEGPRNAPKRNEMVLGKHSSDFMSLVPMQLAYKVCQENFDNLELLQIFLVRVGCVPCSAIDSQHDIRQF